jgi:hypothetical protein
VIIGSPSAAHAVEEYRRRHPEAFVWRPPPGPVQMKAIRRANEMVNVEIGGAGVLCGPLAPSDRRRGAAHPAAAY